MGMLAVEALDTADAEPYESSEEVLRDWLRRQMTSALAANDLGRIVRAMRDVTKLHGMSEVSRATGLNRVNLYRMLSDCGNPKLDTVLKILDVYGLRLTVQEHRTPRDDA